MTQIQGDEFHNRQSPTVVAYLSADYYTLLAKGQFIDRRNFSLDQNSTASDIFTELHAGGEVVRRSGLRAKLSAIRPDLVVAGQGFAGDCERDPTANVTLSTLIRVAEALGHDLQISVTPRPRAAKPAPKAKKKPVPV